MTARILVFGVVVLSAPVFVGLGLSWTRSPRECREADPWRELGSQYVGSEACEVCHPDHHASWQQTFHRTMTQEASDTAVLGAFDGRTLAYGDRSSRVFRDGERLLMTVPTSTGERTAEVTMTVGSRRYQQYFERVTVGDGFELRRLPWLWHQDAARWMHINTVFLEPDDRDGPTSPLTPDWNRHATSWNSNCIFCHNTGPRPGELDYFQRLPDHPRRFQSRVAELGIACEACHGPGAAHADARRNPLLRAVALEDGLGDPTIVQPERLDAERGASVCGQCHGQRLPRPIENIAIALTTGPTFRPGDRLEDHVRPVTVDTPAEGADPDLFRQRFWADGTPRLTAYEYQGLRASPCHQRGSLTCTSCHAMHDGDRHGMLAEPMRGDAACTQCHADFERDVPAHSGHRKGEGQPSCLDCHMPRMVFGILEIHRSHRIENPDPQRDGENGRPHACTLCHLDRSLEWSAREMSKMFGKPYAAPRQRADGAPVALADGLASLLAGDAVQRASYAVAFGRESAGAALGSAAPFAERPLAVTVGDGYPAIRWFAARSLTRPWRDRDGRLQAILEPHDVLDGDLEQRRATVERLFRLLEEDPRRRAAAKSRPEIHPSLTRMASWARLQSKKPLSIGE